MDSSITAARRKILSLAISGKLVPQDPADEPAVALLERIRAEQTRKEEKQIRKCAPATLRSDDNSYYTGMPETWTWVQLKDLTAAGQNSFSDGPFGSNLKTEHYIDKPEVRIIQLSNIGESGWRDENKKYTTFAHAETISRSKVLPGDIVIAKMMPAGRAVQVPDIDGCYVLCSDAIKFVPSKELDKRFLLYAINSSFVKAQIIEEVQGMGRARTSLGKLRKYFIPIPPLAEQLRIVAAIEAAFEQLNSITAKLA